MGTDQVGREDRIKSSTATKIKDPFAGREIRMENRCSDPGEGGKTPSRRSIQQLRRITESLSPEAADWDHLLS